MKKLALSALALGALSLSVACGGGGKDDPVLPDAAPTPDGGSNGICDVLAGTGCEAGEKCTFELPSAENPNPPMTAPSVCLPAGAVPVGGTCAYTPADSDPTNFVQDKDCVVGSQCIRGLCRTVCGDEPDACADDGSLTCRTFGGIWDDQASPLEIGHCEEQCNPLTQAECRNELGEAGTEDDRVDGCFRKFYLDPGRTMILDIDFQCFFVDTETNIQTAAGDACVGPAAGQCFLNGVPRGTTLMGMGADAPAVVTPYCAADNAHGAIGAEKGLTDVPMDVVGRPSDCNAGNFQSGNFECFNFDEVAIFFLNDGTAKADAEAAFTQLNADLDLPTGVGVCLDPAATGTVGGMANTVLYPPHSGFDLADYVADVALDGIYTDGEPYNLCQDCISTDAWLEATQGAGARVALPAKPSARMEQLKIVTDAPRAPMNLQQATRQIVQ